MKHIFSLLFLIYFLPLQSFAQLEEEKTKLEEAKKLFQKATDFWNEEKYNLALEYYLKANEVMPHYVNLYNIAKCYERLGNYEEAIRYYDNYIVEYRQKENTDPPEIKDIEKTTELLREKLYLSLPEVQIITEPEGANIYINDMNKILGQSPITTHLDFGSYKLKLELAGYEKYETDFEIKSRQPLKLHFKMKKEIKVGGLKFNVNIKKARIYIDGKVYGVTPYEEPIEVAEGEHQILIEKERYVSFSKMVKVKSGETINVGTDLYLESPPYSWRGYTGWVAAALGIGSITTGLFYFRKVANEKFKGSSQFNDFKRWTNISYIAGGSLIAIAAGLIIWEYTRKAVEKEDLISSHFYISPCIEKGIFAGGTINF